MVGDTLLAGADGDTFIDSVLCITASIMLDATGGIPDGPLRTYICGRLLGRLSPIGKRGKGQKKTRHEYRNAFIVGRLVAPLLDRFNATRNAETKHAESACSITQKALVQVDMHMSEKRIENIWGRFSHLYVPAK